MIDTCQAASMYEKFYSPNILAVASSLVGEDSLSVNIMQDFILSTFWKNVFQHHVDPAIGVYIIDRYTYFALDFLEKVEPDSKQSMGEFVSYFILVVVNYNKSVGKFTAQSVPQTSLHINCWSKEGFVPKRPISNSNNWFLWSASSSWILLDLLELNIESSVEVNLYESAV